MVFYIISLHLYTFTPYQRDTRVKAHIGVCQSVKM